MKKASYFIINKINKQGEIVVFAIKSGKWAWSNNGLGAIRFYDRSSAEMILSLDHTIESREGAHILEIAGNL